MRIQKSATSVKIRSFNRKQRIRLSVAVLISVLAVIGTVVVPVYLIISTVSVQPDDSEPQQEAGTARKDQHTPKDKPNSTRPPTPPPTKNRPGRISGKAFPDASNTGVPFGKTLRPYTSPLTITAPGTVIDGFDVSGQINVKAANVVIQNSRFTGNGEFYAVNVLSGNVTITDTEIRGNYQAAALCTSNWACIRCNIHGLPADGVKLGSNVLLQDSYLHHFVTKPGAHADGGQVQGGVRNVTIRHNHIDITNPNGTQGNSALFIAPQFGDADGPTVIDGNLFGGGNYSVWVLRDKGNGASDPPNYNRNVTVTNNRFKRNFRYGPFHSNTPSAQSGNVWDDTGAPAPLK